MREKAATNVRVVDFLDAFVLALREDLERGERKWGDTWLNRPRAGQEDRIRRYILDKFDRSKYGGEPINWPGIAGEAMIGWIRDQHPEMFPGGDVK